MSLQRFRYLRAPDRTQDRTDRRARVLPHEGASFWALVCLDLANRGINDVLIMCFDGLTGFPLEVPSRQSRAIRSLTSTSRAALLCAGRPHDDLRALAAVVPARVPEAGGWLVLQLHFAHQHLQLSWRVDRPVRNVLHQDKHLRATRDATRRHLVRCSRGAMLTSAVVDGQRVRAVRGTEFVRPTFKIQVAIPPVKSRELSTHLSDRRPRERPASRCNHWLTTLFTTPHPPPAKDERSVQLSGGMAGSCYLVRSTTPKATQSRSGR